MNVFTFIGQIAPIKDSEKFHPIERKKFESSGWTNTICRFNIVSGTNRIMCTVQGGKYIDDAKNSVRTLGQRPENGGKRESLTISWDKRFDKDQIDKVAGFRHYVADLDNSKKRYKLRDLVEAFKKGNDTTSLVEETGCTTLEQAQEALDRSEKRRHVFITNWDFAEYMTKVVTSDKIKGKMFRISGNQDVQYNNGKYYTTYTVNRVELVEDMEPSTTMNVDFYFADDCVSDEEHIGYVNGWSTYYDNSLKKNGFMPMCIVSRGGDKEIRGLKRKLVVGEGEIGNIGLVVNVIDGAEMSAITYDDLSDEDKADIDCGFTTLEEIQRALGGSKIGDRIQELRFNGLNARKRTVEDTTYTVEDMKPATADVKEDSVNIFDDEDDI